MVTPILFLGLISYLLFFATITQYTAWLEMIVYPYLLNHGFTLYKDLITPYTPIIIWTLQFIESIFGFIPQTTFLMTLSLAIINIFLIWYFSKKIWKESNIIGFLCSIFYCLWFFYFEGNALWFESFLTPILLVSLFFTYKFFFINVTYKNLWLGGLFLALAFFSKQSTIWISGFVIFWLFFSFRNNFKKVLKYSSIFLSPYGLLFLLTSAIAAFQNSLTEYWYWTFKYTFLEAPFYPDNPSYPGLNEIFKLFLSLVVIIPFVLFNRKKLTLVVFMLGFLLSSALIVFPRWELFHLQPFLAILSVVAIPSLYTIIRVKSLIKTGSVLILVVIWLIVIGKQLERFKDKPIRFFEPDKYKVAQVLKEKGYLDFYTHNSSDQLYVLTDTVPRIKPFIQYFYSFQEVSNMQEKVVISLEEKKPKFVLYTPFSGKGGINPGDYRPKLISNYIDYNYHLKEKIGNEFWILERNK